MTCAQTRLHPVGITRDAGEEFGPTGRETVIAYRRVDKLFARLARPDDGDDPSPSNAFGD